MYRKPGGSGRTGRSGSTKCSPRGSRAILNSSLQFLDLVLKLFDFALMLLLLRCVFSADRLKVQNTSALCLQAGAYLIVLLVSFAMETLQTLVDSQGGICCGAPW